MWQRLPSPFSHTYMQQVLFQWQIQFIMQIVFLDSKGARGGELLGLLRICFSLALNSPRSAKSL